MALNVVNGIRIAEDWIMSFVVSIGFVLMVYAGIKLKKHQIPIGNVPLLTAIGLIPLLIWKMMGGYRRVFVDKATSADFYNFLHDTGEAFEAFSGILIAIILLIIYKRNTDMLR